MTAAPSLAHLADGHTDQDPKATWTEYRALIEDAMVNAPRSLQKRIGPSELGMACRRCLAHKLAGTPEHTEAAWLPQVGSAVHAWLEEVFVQANAGLDRARFLVESRVTVGTVGGIEITGSADLYDRELGEVTDWKIVGTTTLRSAKAKGASPVYRAQAMLYGRGFTLRGLPVRRVRIAYLPRNAVALSDAYIWTADYDEQLALDTIARADALAIAISAFGLDHVLASLPGHDGDGFSCRRMPDYTPPTVAATDPSNPFG